MAGDPAGARDMLSGALPRLAGTTARVRAQRLEGAICFAQGNAAEAARILASAAQAVAGDDTMARDTMLLALQAAIWAGPARPGKSPARRAPSRLSRKLRRRWPARR